MERENKYGKIVNSHTWNIYGEKLNMHGDIVSKEDLEALVDRGHTQNCANNIMFGRNATCVCGLTRREGLWRN